MRQSFTTAPMTAAAFAGEAFSCARANGAVCAFSHTAILLGAAFAASILVILGILSISLLGLVGLLVILISLITLALLIIPGRLKGWRSRFR